MQVRGVHCTAKRLVGKVGRRQLARAVEKKGGRPRSASSPRMQRGRLECKRDGLVRVFDRRGQLPCTRLRILQELGEPGVDLGAAYGIGRLVRPRGEQRVREANPVALELDDPRLERRRQTRAAPHAGRGLGETSCRVCVCGSREQVVTALRRKRKQPSVHELVKRLRHRQRLPGLDGDALSLQCSHDLERVERVPPRRHVHLGEKGPRKRYSKVVVHNVVERTQVDGTDLDVGEALRRKRTRELGQQRALQRNAPRDQDADALGTQPPRGVAERSGGGCVEPLDVVDGDEDRGRLGKRAQRAENGNSDGALVEGRPIVLLEHERTGQGTALGIGKRRECLVEYRVEEIAYPRERQRGLALRRTRLEDAKSERFRLGDACRPQGRLPHARLALQHERRRPAGDAAQEVTDGSELELAPDDVTGHDASIVRLTRRRQQAARRLRTYSRGELHDLRAVQARVGSSWGR